jgi:Zn finger protein HypA/HybF involved in hydrogenase expression
MKTPPATVTCWKCHQPSPATVAGIRRRKCPHCGALLT